VPQPTPELSWTGCGVESELAVFPIAALQVMLFGALALWRLKLVIFYFLLQ
jgi:hypothetical protein